MKPERQLVAERPVASHCAELIRTAPGADQLLPQLNRVGERFARLFAPVLAPLAGGKGLTIKAKPARLSTLDDIAMFAPDLAANSLLALGPEQWPVLASLDAAAVLRIVDRTFGGRGEAPSPLPAEFPVSAELMIVRLESLVRRELGGLLLPDHDEPLQPLRRDGSLTLLEPFAKDEPLAVIELDVAEPAGDTWIITLALQTATLVSLFGAAPRKPAAARPGPADPLSAPFADLPLELSAVLVDMRMAMATLAAIEPGQVLPVAVARQVPLRIGERTIATGTVGAADDCVALQITAAF